MPKTATEILQSVYDRDAAEIMRPEVFRPMLAGVLLAICSSQAGRDANFKQIASMALKTARVVEDMIPFDMAAAGDQEGLANVLAAIGVAETILMERTKRS